LELGISLKLKKDIVLLTQDSDKEVPFDVRDYRLIRYENTKPGWEGLSDKISEAIRNWKLKHGEAARQPSAP
jgi:hypothetical protein